MTVNTFPETFELKDATRVPLVEKILLPSIDMTSCERSILFPAEAKHLIPVALKQVSQKLPRMSLFSSNNRVILDGFRLYEIDGSFFTDASLVSPPENSAMQIQRWKSSPHVPEDIDLSMLGSRDQLIRIERPGPVLLPQSDEPSNFGSWLFRFIPKLLLTKNASDHVSVLAYVRPNWTRNLLNLVGVDCEIIPHNPVCRYLISNPVIPSLAVPSVLFRPEALKLMWDLIKADDCGELGERIYVSRLGQTATRPNHRNLENERELLERLERIGFREFRPEDHPIERQISIFSRAKIIVGVGGSNMFGCIFAKNAELIVDVESGDEWMFAHSNLLSSLPAHFSIVKGVRKSEDAGTPHVHWVLDVDAFIVGLSRLGIR